MYSALIVMIILILSSHPMQPISCNFFFYSRPPPLYYPEIITNIGLCNYQPKFMFHGSNSYMNCLWFKAFIYFQAFLNLATHKPYEIVTFNWHLSLISWFPYCGLHNWGCLATFGYIISLHSTMMKDMQEPTIIINHA